MLHVVATIEAKPGKREALLAEFHRIVDTVRQEEGCLEYGPTVDVDSGLDVQPPVRDDTVTVIEKWENLDALKAHLNAPHMTEYRQRVADIVENFTVSVFEPA